MTKCNHEMLSLEQKYAMCIECGKKLKYNKNGGLD